MGRHSYTQPSSSEASLASDGRDAVNYTPRSIKRSGRCGIPGVCYCGSVPVTHTSTTELNPGRVFFGCKNHKDGGHHVFKWWDEALVEEMNNLRWAVENQAGTNRVLGLRGGGGDEACFIRDTLSLMKLDISELKEVLVKKHSIDLNVVVLVGVIICLITYIICKNM